MTFPLKFKVFKPRERLKEEDKYKTKPELGAELIKELKAIGFKIKRVLADSLYGESHSNFISVIEELGIEYAVAIRSNHGVWLPKEAKVRANKWREFQHIRWDKKKETRYIREIIYGKRREIQYWEITRDQENIKPENIWFVMTKIPPIPQLTLGFPRLIAKINEVNYLHYLVYLWDDFCYSSA